MVQLSTVPVSKQMLNQLRDLGTAAISDAKEGNDVLDRDISLQTSSSDVAVAGIAHTILFVQRSIHPVIQLFEHGLDEEENPVILIINSSGIHGAVWGEIFTRMALKLPVPVLACIVDGGIRDLGEINHIGSFPVWARYTTPVTITKKWAFNQPQEFSLDNNLVNQPITCGGVLVRPGDIVVANMDGIIIVRKEEARDVLAKAKMIRQMEQKLV